MPLKRQEWRIPLVFEPLSVAEAAKAGWPQFGPGVGAVGAGAVVADAGAGSKRSAGVCGRVVKVLSKTWKLRLAMSWLTGAAASDAVMKA